MPFGNMLETIKISGKNIRAALEHSVHDYTTSDPSGRFLQVSGLKVVYDLSKPTGNRVVSVQVRCAECDVPSYSELVDDEIYDVISITFLLDAGDGHKALSQE